jgi:hypothetical protein
MLRQNFVFNARFAVWVPRLSAKAVKLTHDKNNESDRLCCAPALRRMLYVRGYPSGEKGVKRDACLSLKGEAIHRRTGQLLLNLLRCYYFKRTRKTDIL